MVNNEIESKARQDLKIAAQWAVIILAILAVATAVAVAKDFLVPVIVAFLLSLVFSPLCRWLRRRGIPEPLSAAVIIFALFSGIVTVSGSLAVPVSEWIDDAPRITREVEQKLKALSGVAKAMKKVDEQVQRATNAETEEA